MTERLSTKAQLGKVLARAKRLVAPEGVEPNWAKILDTDRAAWKRMRGAAARGPKVLIATSTGGHAAVTPVESLLAAALTMRGADVHFLLCDRFLPACLQAISAIFPDQAEFAEHGPSRTLCADCFSAGHRIYEGLGLPIHLYSELVTSEEIEAADELAKTIPLEEISDYRPDGLAVGEHALAGALRYFAKGSLEDEPYGEAILRRYLKASLLTVKATSHLVESYGFDAACFHHGIYVPQGMIGEVMRDRKVRLANWSVAYRKHCFIFSHGDTYHHTLMAEPTATWEDMPWTRQMETQLMEYLKSRWHGTRDWIWFHEKPEEELAAIAQELGIDLSKPSIGLLTNVVWDAQLHYPANAFPNMIEWLLQTVRYFAGRPDLQLIIRIHPAEIRGTVPSRQRCEDVINKAFPDMPRNVFVIPPDSKISTYAVMEICNAVIIYGTKTGIELASIGVPVVVGGEAWVRNKGITLDANSPEEYFELLGRLPLPARLDDAALERARKYAYHFFFRRMVPLPFTVADSGGPPFKLAISQLNDLVPGKNPGLDMICDGILKGDAFVYPAETQPQEAFQD